MVRIIIVAGCTLALFLATARADAADLSTGTLLDTRVNSAGQEITVPTHPQLHVAVFSDPSGWASKWHRHVYPRYVYVLEGALTVENEDDGKRVSIHAGQFYVEMIGEWHRGMNLGPGPVKFLVIDQVTPGTGPNMIMQKQKQ